MSSKVLALKTDWLFGLCVRKTGFYYCAFILVFLNKYAFFFCIANVLHCSVTVICFGFHKIQTTSNPGSGRWFCLNMDQPRRRDELGFTA